MKEVTVTYETLVTQECRQWYLAVSLHVGRSHPRFAVSLDWLFCTLQTSYGDWSFAVSGWVLWNSLSAELCLQDMISMITLYFMHLCKSLYGWMSEQILMSHMTHTETRNGFALNLALGLSCGRNHKWQSFLLFQFCSGSNFAILHWLSLSPLIQCCVTSLTVTIK